MLEIGFKPSFIKQFKQLEKDLRQEVEEKIELLKDKRNHATLKVHKLHGPLPGYWSFSVNYKTKIVFEQSGNEIVLLAIGNHDVYKN
ncbi:MAG: hypothetical protein A3H57_01225 [Candidatus Taylorbacteria bacterium RIFCSPLOWO2_02_FULL_43_11]|uniref:Plasmid stabilization system n=1 Tax=Candidatus Taylorbacteria bacterium RIFCSPHIGHO2_02_FULL_43_32b TaxID=1802306 RepID=A0A1G2MDJ5_9BACT|nr:MAG: hypothetical protein A2743_03805 [Candidatus Taylorbacteria bacterium RIFCSPHIGHO2_01_FULL_43_47]OHA21980.1 MAG: hypothetical protein A3C72_01125 [Candidatus Taylorbacteria bacterium RIFCSPHIGHO2_02_FULL_43_32b]OHA35681.1 MAG: hypothetical protein A3H57_01225 [Candidatus Taylorbacteria bacterium RIFCSPLOWO2_02_FULL_43_11]